MERKTNGKFAQEKLARKSKILETTFCGVSIEFTEK
jgi:hypothetical protein